MGLFTVLIVKGRGDLVYFLLDLQTRVKPGGQEDYMDGFLWECSVSSTTALSLMNMSEQGVSSIQGYPCLSHVQPQEKGPLQKG